MSTTAVRLACPDWCDISMEDHGRDIDLGGTNPIHQSAVVCGDWILSTMHDANGKPTPERPGYAPIMLMDGDDAIHPDDAERLAHALLEMVATAREGAAR